MESEEGLLLVVMQHVRYMVSMSVKRVFLNLEFLPPGLPRGPYLESCLEESRGWDAALV